MADTARQLTAFVDIKRWWDHGLAEDRSHLHMLPILSHVHPFGLRMTL